MKRKRPIIKMASQTKLEEFDTNLEDIILECLGHPGALVTDESEVRDFLNVFDTSNDQVMLDKLSDLCAIPVTVYTKIIDLIHALDIRSSCDCQHCDTL